MISPDLRQIDWFSKLSSQTLERIAPELQPRRFAPGEMILMEGDPCEAVYFLLRGEVSVFRTGPDGREQVLVHIQPGKAFNTVPPLQAQALNHSSARAVTASAIYALPAPAYLRLLQTYPDLTFAALTDFSDRLSHLSRLVESLSLYRVRGRLARFLVEHASDGKLERRWTQDEIARHLGSVRDVIGRTLRAFAEAGYVVRRDQTLWVLDRAGLEREAKE